MIAVKEMEMPDTCAECNFAIYDERINNEKERWICVCSPLKTLEKVFDARQGWCPLVENVKHPTILPLPEEGKEYVANNDKKYERPSKKERAADALIRYCEGKTGCDDCPFLIDIFCQLAMLTNEGAPYKWSRRTYKVENRPADERKDDERINWHLEKAEPVDISKLMAHSDDLINRQAAVDAVYERIKQLGYENDAGILSIRQALRDVPGVQAEPVKHGHWIIRSFDMGGVSPVQIPFCSVCDKPNEAPRRSKRCPNCGAKMDESTIGQLKAEGAVKGEKE